MHPCMYVEAKGGCLVLLYDFLPNSFELRSLNDPRFRLSISQPQRSSFPHPQRLTFHMSAGDSNTGPQTCTASPLTPEISPYSPFLGFLFFGDTRVVQGNEYRGWMWGGLMCAQR